MYFCAVQKRKKKNNKTKIFKIQHEFSDRCSKHGIYTLPGRVVGWGKSVVCLTSPGVQLIFAYSWARPAILAEGKGRGGNVFISSVSLLSFIFLSPLSLSFISSTVSYLSSPFFWETTQKWPTSVDVSLNSNSIKSITRCPVTKQAPFIGLWTNRHSVSVVVNSLY